MTDEPPTSARDVLIAELIGEVSTLMNRIDQVIPAVTAICDAITHAGADLEANAVQAERRIAAFTEAAKAHAVKHIAKRTAELARSSAEAELEAMRRAMREAIRVELEPALQPLPRRHPANAAGLGSGARWWTYAITAACAAAVGAATATYALSAFAP